MVSQELDNGKAVLYQPAMAAQLRSELKEAQLRENNNKFFSAEPCPIELPDQRGEG